MRAFGLLVWLILGLAACGEKQVLSNRPEGGAEVESAGSGAPPTLSGSRSAVTDEERDAPDPGPGDGPPFFPVGGFDVVVEDAEGRPIAGARVSHPRSTARTDAEGRARLGAMGFDLGMPSQDRYWKTVTVRAEGYLPVARAHPWDADHVARFCLVDRGYPIQGRVVDASGSALGGVPLELRAAGCPSILMTTDESGSFATWQVPPSVATLRVSGSSYFADPVAVVPPQEHVEIVAWPVCGVRGVLKLDSGTSLPEKLVIQAEGHSRS